VATTTFKDLKAMMGEIQASADKLNASAVVAALMLGRRAHTATVLVSAAALDRTLERAIATRLPSLNREFRDRLFDESRPLRSFSAKIDLGFALGLADRETYKRLTAIRKVRNLFAHSDKTLSFESKSVHELFALAPGVSAPASSIDDFKKIVDLADKSITSAAGIPSLWVKPGKPKPAKSLEA
jgi:DNA-binding MltR family transcriptional regulator